MTTFRRWFRRFRTEAGASVPEYALLLGAFAVISFGAFDQLRDESDEELTETSDCIGKLPNEPGCGLGAEEVPPDPLDPTSDPDGDTIPNSADNCPTTFNSDQADTDGDTLGDACDPTPNGDDDGDGVDNLADNCPSVPNPADPDTGEQLDADDDDLGDPCDFCDAVPGGETDTDVDGVGDICDNCPDDSNPGQEDSDLDGTGDACELPEFLHATLGPAQARGEGGSGWGSGPSESCPNVSGGTYYCYRVRALVTNTLTSAVVSGAVVTVSLDPEGTVGPSTKTCVTDVSGVCWISMNQYLDSGTVIDFVIYTTTGVTGSLPWDSAATTATASHA